MSKEIEFEEFRELLRKQYGEIVDFSGNETSIALSYLESLTTYMIDKSANDGKEISVLKIFNNEVKSKLELLLERRKSREQV